MDKSRILSGTNFIRFGQWIDSKGKGDELTGWFKLDELELVLEVGKLDREGRLEYKGNTDE